MESNHFRRKPPNKKRKEPRRIGSDRVRLPSRTGLRWQVYSRSSGTCESESVAGIPHHKDCPRVVGWHDGELAHLRHSSNKTDTLDGTYWASRQCHQISCHNPKSCNRRPGKPMKIKDAQEYWNGKICFCDQPKKERESFCSVCRGKLSPQVAYDLENSDDPDTYRQTLALAENEILMWRPE